MTLQELKDDLAELMLQSIDIPAEDVLELLEDWCETLRGDIISKKRQEAE